MTLWLTLLLAADSRGRDYLRWILSKDFPADTKEIVAAALDGRFPQVARTEAP